MLQAGGDFDFLGRTGPAPSVAASSGLQDLHRHLAVGA